MSSKDDQIRATRWLYDDEKSYQSVMAQLKIEELKAQKEKQLIRRYRQRQRRLWLKKVKNRLQPATSTLKRLSRKQAIIGGVTVIAVAAVGSWATWHHRTTQSAKTLGANTVIPDFKPAKPAAGNQTLTTTDTNNQKVVSYHDMYQGVNLTVSQQKLPDSFKNDPQAISKLDQFQNADTLDTAKGKLYIVSNKTGQQWAALIFDDVLIFFQADKQLSFENWYGYINSLQIQ